MTTDTRAAMLARRDALLTEHPEITAAADLAPLLGEHEAEYWQWQLERTLTDDTTGETR